VRGAVIRAAHQGIALAACALSALAAACSDDLRPLPPADLEARAAVLTEVQARLAELQGADVLKAVSLLRHADHRVRRAAALRLMEMGPAAAPAVEDLASALGDEEPRVRTAAARALSKTGSAAAVEPLAACLGDGERQVRLWCWKALRGLGDGTIPALADMLVTGSEMRKLSYKDEAGRKRHWQDELTERLAAVGAPAVEPLAAKMGIEDPQLRGALLRTFGLMGPEGKGALPVVISLLENAADADTRVRAMQAIEKIGDLHPDVMPSLRRAAESKDKKISAQATKTLRALEKAAKAKPKTKPKKKSAAKPKPEPKEKPPI
jgi:hypothetical protein